MTAIASAPPSRLDLALLALRIVVGTIFMAHGGQKVFTYGIAGITAGFEKMHVPIPGFTAPAVGFLELIGGALLILGLLGRLIPALFVIDMLGAIIFVHFKNGFFLPTGFEFVLVLCAVSLALALTGPGLFSVDAMLARRR